MSHYQGRSFGGSPIGGGIPKFQSLGGQLAANKQMHTAAASKIVVKKPVLSSSKDKEMEIKRTLESKYIPGKLKLDALRKLAKEGKILGENARDFVHRSEAGRRLDSSQSIKKFESELLEAELEATQDVAGSSPLKYKFRQGGKTHLEAKAKEMVKGLYQDNADQAKEAAMQTHELSKLEERRAHLNTVHGIIGQAKTQNASAPGMHRAATTMPQMQEVAPLSSVEQPVSLPNRIPSYSAPLSAPPTGVGIHVPGAYQNLDTPNPSMGVPIVAGHEPTVPAPHVPTASEAVAPVEPVVSPVPAHDVQLPDTSHLGDAFGGDE